jgi:23S rRNA pseudouridine1911/1915/1917 synthase
VKSELPVALDGERVDRVVALLTGATRARAVTLIADGAVRIDDTVVTKGSMRVAAGTEIAIDAADTRDDAALVPDPSVSFDVVHEDLDLVVVDKPAGLVVHPGAGNAAGTLVNGLIARYPEIAGVGEPTRPGIVHRIDKDTSGLLLVARSAIGYAALRELIGSHSVVRRYLALVWGHPDATQGLVDAPIGRSIRTPTRMTVSARGREARTRYEVLDLYDEPATVALLRCTLDTGRTHQIRVHLQTIGHPVVGDRRYGGSRPPFVDLRRFFLHAAVLELDHPVTGARLAFESRLPPELDDVLSRLRARASRREPSPPHRQA